MRSTSGINESAPMIYLDNAATSFPKPEAVYQALDRFARQSLANPGRAGHKMAVEAERALDDARHLLNQFFHGEGPERFVFTLNCTDALNMAFKGVLQEGDHVVTTNLEHNSVSRPLRAMELAGRIGVTRVPADGGGILDQAFEIALRPGLHCAPYMHRALGTFPDGTVRVSPGPFNTEADIDRLAGALAEILV